MNSFGDEQLAVDLLADKLLFEALRFSRVCKWACSEEVPEPVDMEGTFTCLGMAWRDLPAAHMKFTQATCLLSHCLKLIQSASEQMLSMQNLHCLQIKVMVNPCQAQF